MILEASSLENGKIIDDCDVCIMGAGAAGITIARELGAKGMRVVVLEGGGLNYEDESQAFYAGDNIGHRFPDLTINRLRFLGGTTNHWEGSCSQLSELDFEARPWVADSGWPIERASMDPFYTRAHEVVQIAPPSCDVATVTRRTGLAPMAADSAIVESVVGYHSPPTRFGEVYRHDLETIPGIRVLLHANVTEILLTGDSQAVREIRCAVVDGPRFTVRGRVYVLAMGGIENARMLLLSNSVQPNGVGNHHDMVGRYFMDHPVLAAAAFLPSAKAADMRFYGQFRIDGKPVSGRMMLKAEVCRARQLSNVNIPFLPENRFYASEGINSIHYIHDLIGEGKVPDHLLHHIANVFGDFEMVAEGASRRLLNRTVSERSNDFAYYLCDTMTEQAPNPQSRVTLSDRRDALGLRRLQLDWRISRQDHENIWRCFDLVSAELARLGAGRMQVFRDREELLWERYLSFANHHMGTTRMSADPKTGVVDADCRVHGVANLFIGGSSTFPTGGSVPPTLTIVALALRLSDHLARVMARPA